MTSTESGPQKGKQFEFYMDLLGHDILNSNQAVLSYLELIAASPGADKKTRIFAEKAIAHVRTSTVLVENVKRLMATRTVNIQSLKPIDLLKAIELAEVEVSKFYPGKKIRIDIAAKPRNAFVCGNSYAADLIRNMLITAARLDQGDDIRMSLSIQDGTFSGKPAWIIRLENKNAQLPPFLDGEGVAATYAQDISRTGKTAGMLFAKMIATNLGGDFDAHAISHEPKKKGAIFTIVLRKADRT